MALKQRFPEWRNRQERVNYPFSDRATLFNAFGVEIDRELFVDAAIYPVGGSAGAYLKQLTVSRTSIIFTIADPVNGDTATGTYTFGSDETAQPGLIKLVDRYNRTAGVLVSDKDKLELLNGIYPIGKHLFKQAQTEFVSSVVTPLPAAGVRGFILDDGEVISGEAWLVGSSGIVLRYENGEIIIDAVGDPYALSKDCELDQAQPPTPFCGLRTLNNITPDAAGNFSITVGGNVAADNVLRIEQDGSRMLIKLVGKRNMGE